MQWDDGFTSKIIQSGINSGKILKDSVPFKVRNMFWIGQTTEKGKVRKENGPRTHDRYKNLMNDDPEKYTKREPK